MSIEMVTDKHFYWFVRPRQMYRLGQELGYNGMQRLAFCPSTLVCQSISQPISIEHKTEQHFYWLLDLGRCRVGADEWLDFNLDIGYT
jgi:hypothetical protein